MVVDMMKSSAFGGWVGEELSVRNRLMRYIPLGFAHGFISLEDGTEVIYLADSHYSKSNERGGCPERPGNRCSLALQRTDS